MWAVREVPQRELMQKLGVKDELSEQLGNSIPGSRVIVHERPEVKERQMHLGNCKVISMAGVKQCFLVVFT